MTTETNFTPGPWVVEENPTIGEGVQVAAFSTDGNRAMQCIVRSFNPDHDIRLIAAAPEIYEALDTLIHAAENEYGVKSSALNDAKFALAKARG